MKSGKFLFFILLALCLVIGVNSCEVSGTDPVPDEGQYGDSDVNNDDDDNNGDDSTVNGEPNTEFVMLFTNDFHSQIEPTDNGRGGVLRMKALVDSVRAVEPHVLLADAGDLVQGTYYFSLLNGVVEMKMLEMLKYDIRTIGNHEFDKKMSGLGEMFALSKVPVVASNYDFSQTTLSKYVVPSKILNAGSIKVGFIGLNVRLLNLVLPTACEGVVWQDAINVADTYAKELKDQGADIIIAISHLGYGGEDTAKYYDTGIAMRTQHIDMIIGGHSHTALYSPTYIKNIDGDLVPIVQTGSRGYCLGYAKIKFDKAGKPSFDYKLIPVDARLDDRVDNQFADIIDDYAAEVNEKMNVVLANAPYRISTGNALGNFAADGLAWAMKEYHGEEVDVAMYNTGGLRASIYAGPVTLGDIYAVFPFDNTVPVVTLTGAKFKTLLEKAPGKLYVSSGVKIVKDGSTFTTLTVNGKPIDTNKNYKVAIIDYIADNDGYTSIFNNPVSRVNYVEMVRDYLGEYTKYYADRNGGELRLFDDGRIQY